MRRATATVALLLAALWISGCRSRTACAFFEDSASSGERCTATWADCEDGQDRAVVCVGQGRCECRVDGYTRRSFQRDEFCALRGEESVTDVANRACEWKLRVGEPGPSLPF